MPRKKPSKTANAVKARRNEEMAKIPIFMETDNINERFLNCFYQDKRLSKLRNFVNQLIAKFDKIVFEEELLRRRKVPFQFVNEDAEGRGGWTIFTCNRNRKAKIVLNLEIITTGERLRDILIHECCHVAQRICRKLR